MRAFHDATMQWHTVSDLHSKKNASALCNSYAAQMGHQHTRCFFSFCAPGCVDDADRHAALDSCEICHIADEIESMARADLLALSSAQSRFKLACFVRMRFTMRQCNGTLSVTTNERKTHRNCKRASSGLQSCSDFFGNSRHFTLATPIVTRLWNRVRFVILQTMSKDGRVPTR